MDELGWIKLHRSIRSHWIWKDERKLKWWLDILLEANHRPKKVAIKYKVFECGRGQCLVSLKTWAERWGVNKTAVNNFLRMLKNDYMIETENVTVSTRITICNYDEYQQNENGNETQHKRNRNATETQQSTTKNDKNIKNDKKDIIDKIVDLFKSSYEINFELPYVITNKGKERGCAGKILKHYKDRFPEAKTEEVLNGIEKYFNLCCQIDDTWLNQNMSLSLIINKFNEINKTLRNGNKTNKSGASDWELADMLANKLGTDRPK